MKKIFLPPECSIDAIRKTNGGPAGYNRGNLTRQHQQMFRYDGQLSSAEKKENSMGVRMILAFVVLAATSLLAQTFRGTVLGTVTDASGAVISGANVAVRNVNTGQERTTQTSADGSYAVPELPIGTYTVTITQTGFQTS